MSAISSSAFLRGVLWVDGLGAVGGAAVLIFGADLLALPLGLPAPLLAAVGALMAVIGAGIIWLLRRDPLPRRGVWTVVVLNAVWVVDSILLLVSGYIEPTPLGQVFIVAQAVVVAVIAELEFVALRRPAAMPA